MGMTNLVDTSNDVMWNWEWCPLASGNPFPGAEVEKLVAAFLVPGGDKTNVTNGSGNLAICWRRSFVNLGVSAKGELTMLGVFKFDTSDKSARADG